MSSFRKPVTIKRRGPGQRVAGAWVDGAMVADTITASVQPAKLTDYDELQPLLEGRRIEAVVRVYTDAAVAVAGEGLTNGDLLSWPQGQQMRDYLFVARSSWQSGVIPHFRYLAALLVES